MSTALVTASSRITKPKFRTDHELRRLVAEIRIVPSAGMYTVQADVLFTFSSPRQAEDLLISQVSIRDQSAKYLS